ncbi:MAG: hypothetical protein TREMPRED_002775 [Tremellales sp. Tagirdzhanova-0007]|nr:MAG: hypothetical protein TREMPRED_002775 [Tremellales sp. Tagirdzhanova-0007]
MSSLDDALRFCFPGSSPPRGLPRYSQRASGQGGSDDVTRGTAKMTAASVLRSYAPDWILTIVLWQVVATTQAFVRRNLDPTHFGCLRATLALLSRTAGHKREFSLTDITIQHSFAEHERVPPLLLAIVSVGIPLVVLLPLSSLVSRNRWDVHNSVLGLFMSYTMAGVVTQIVKMTVGRPRPDLISRCLPASGAADHPVFGLSTSGICTTTNTLRLDDGFKSFPSGHSSR